MTEHRPSEVFDEDLAMPEELVTDDQALEAMRQNVPDVIEIWEGQQKKLADERPPVGRLEFTLRKATLQYEAGHNKDAKASLDDLDALRVQAANKPMSLEQVNTIKAIMDKASALRSKVLTS